MEWANVSVPFIRDRLLPHLLSKLVLEVVGVPLRLRENQDQAFVLQVVQGTDQHGELLVLVHKLHLFHITASQSQQKICK